MGNRKHKAPVIYVRHWSEFPAVLSKVERMRLHNPAGLVKRRRDLVQWYREFRLRMSLMFRKAVESKFFNQHILCYLIDIHVHRQSHHTTIKWAVLFLLILFYQTTQYNIPQLIIIMYREYKKPCRYYLTIAKLLIHVDMARIYLKFQYVATNLYFIFIQVYVIY